MEADRYQCYAGVFGSGCESRAVEVYGLGGRGSGLEGAREVVGVGEFAGVFS